MNQAAGSVGADSLDDRFWHYVLFFTTGYIVRDLLESDGVRGYETQAERAGFYERASWSGLPVAFTEHWVPALDGAADPITSMTGVIRAISPLRLTFSGEPQFESSVGAYRSVWRAEGGRIEETLQRVSGMRFPVDSITVEEMEGPSWSGSHSMGLRASYSADTKRATLASSGTS